MRWGGAAPKTPPTGWVFVGCHRNGGVTVRWRRGDQEAYLLRGNQVGSWTADGLLATISVPRRGWADLSEIRVTGEKWVRAR